MSEVLKNPETTPQISKNNPDALAVHPQIQTRYMQNIAAIAKQWNDRFVTETSMQIGGESYGKKENDKQVPDLNSDFWINYANKSIEQQMMSLVNQGISQQKIDMLTNMINDDIRSRVDLTKFGKYIRIESLLLAQGVYITPKK